MAGTDDIYIYIYKLKNNLVDIFSVMVSKGYTCSQWKIFRITFSNVQYIVVKRLGSQTWETSIYGRVNFMLPGPNI